MTTLDLVKFSSLQKSVQGVEDYAARKILSELITAVDQLQKLSFPARSTENDGLPSDNQLCEQINGVFLRFVSRGFADLVHVREHGLGRVPQGCIWIRARTVNNECLIEGDTALGIDAADDTTVTFLIGDPAGQIVVGLLL